MPIIIHYINYIILNFDTFPSYRMLRVVVSNLASYSGSPGFDFSPETGYPNRISVAFLSLSW
jgi:hypothetical protein